MDNCLLKISGSLHSISLNAWQGAPFVFMVYFEPRPNGVEH